MPQIVCPECGYQTSVTSRGGGTGGFVLGDDMAARCKHIIAQKEDAPRPVDWLCPHPEKEIDRVVFRRD